jgi:hydroxymethylglutaryl-CoA reductase
LPLIFSLTENTAPFLAIEESSVVAAASKAAKFWSTRGGFKATVSIPKKWAGSFYVQGDVSKLNLFLLNTK